MIESYDQHHILCNQDVLLEVSMQSDWDLETLRACSCVCKLWETIILKEVIPNWNKQICYEISEKFPDFYANSFFNREKWEQYFGQIGPERPLPRDICKILASDCPSKLSKCRAVANGWESYSFHGTIAETHLLVFVPNEVNGQPLTINLWHELIQHPLQGNPSCYDDIADCTVKRLGEKPSKLREIPSKSNWLLLTTGVLDGSIFSREYQSQVKMVKEKFPDYEVPCALNVITAMFAKYVMTGEYTYGRCTMTHCSDEGIYSVRAHECSGQICVGRFSKLGLSVYISKVPDYTRGIAASRLF